MFSEACVIPSVHRDGLHPGTVCIQGEGLHPGKGGLHPGGRGLHPRGSAIRGACIQGVSIQWSTSGGLHLGSLHPGGSASGRIPHPLRYMGYYGVRSESGRYASYWNAFLLQKSVADTGFSLGGAPTPISAITLQFFCRKLHENEIIWTPSGGASLALPFDQPMIIITCIVLLNAVQSFDRSPKAFQLILPVTKMRLLLVFSSSHWSWLSHSPTYNMWRLVRFSCTLGRKSGLYLRKISETTII